jgi:hypothetical protein
MTARPDSRAKRRVVWFDPATSADPPRPFRAGEVSSFEWGEDDVMTRSRVTVAPNSLHALYGHGVVDALNRLPLALGPIAPRADAVLRATALSEASRILYEADRSTYGRTWEFTVGGDATNGDADIEYRIAIDNREYQRTLSRLQYLVVLAGREGRAVRLRL